MSDLMFTLKESDRCARGRGWEAGRRGETLAANPFDNISSDGKTDWQWEEWRQGWLDFQTADKIKRQPRAA